MTAAPIRILVAEDDPDILEMLEIALVKHGMDVVSTRHGGEALAALRGPPPLPHLILLDLMMRVMDGTQFLAAKQADPALAAIPVVVMTALGRAEQHSAGLVVAGWLSKPLRLAELYKTIDSLLRDERMGGP